MLTKRLPQKPKIIATALMINEKILIFVYNFA